MHKLKEAIVVEGKYDKNTLSQIIDAPIFVTNGFGIFKDKPQMDLLRRVAQQRGLVVFTDADGAGFVIRNHIKSVIPAQHLKHAYTPDIFGKERRKVTAGKEGKLGVEGMHPEIILDALRASGATFLGEEAQTVGDLSKQDLVEMGLSGGPQSAQMRLTLLKHLGLPEHMSANALLEALNLLYSREEVLALVNNIFEA
jgi:ribonuclease M5